MRRISRITTALLLLLCLAAFADHDDGDDRHEFSYVMEFNKIELSQFKSLIMITNSPHDQYLEIRKLSGEQSKMSAITEYQFYRYGGEPTILWAIPSRQIEEKIEAWLKANVHPLEGTTQTVGEYVWVSDESIAAFRKAFASKVIEFSYARSVVLANMFKLSKCHVHFLKPKGSKLIRIRESVGLVSKGHVGRILPVGFRFEYGGASKSFFPEQAEKLNLSDFRELLSKGADPEEVATFEAEVQRWERKYEASLNPGHTHFNESTRDPVKKSWKSYLWFLGVPGLSCLVLLALYRRRTKRVP